MRKIQPDQLRCALVNQLEQVMMIHPDNRDEQITDAVTQSSWPQRKKRVQRWLNWRFQVQHHDRDDHAKTPSENEVNRSVVVFLLSMALSFYSNFPITTVPGEFEKCRFP